MRKSFLFIATIAALGLFAGSALATKLTEQQVKNVCGSSMTTGGTGGATVSGCEKKCGDKICTYNCCSGKNCPGGQGCNGNVVGLTTGGGGKTKGPLPAATLKEIKASEITVNKKIDAGSPALMKTNTNTLKTNDSLTTRSNALSSGSTTTLKKQDNTLMKR
jgi:hypothetical protein